MSSLDASTAELSVARKIFWLLANDYAFLSTYDETSKNWDDGTYPCINCNDVFVPGADAESLSAEDLDLYIEACKTYGDAAPVAWCAAKRNSSPWRAPSNPSWAQSHDEAKTGILAILARHRATAPHP